MRTIGTFPTEDPKDLDRALGQFEENVVRAIDEVSASAETTPTMRAPTRRDATIQCGECLPVDSSGGNVKVQFPTATAANRGQRVRVLRVNTSNTVTLEALPGARGACPINGAASVTMAASVGVRTFISDGSAWWSD